jgi:hypothetical protein
VRVRTSRRVIRFDGFFFRCPSFRHDRLAPRLSGILAVRVALPDAPVASVEEQFSFIPSGDLSGGKSRLCLSAVDGPCPAISRYLDPPSLVARYHMYVSLSHACKFPPAAVFETTFSISWTQYGRLRSWTKVPREAELPTDHSPRPPHRRKRAVALDDLAYALKVRCGLAEPPLRTLAEHVGAGGQTTSTAEPQVS